MKTPIYRAGQLVNIPSCLLNGEASKGFTTQCQILYPFEDGRYFVRVCKTGGYAVVEEKDFSTYPEYDQEKPAERSRIRIVFFGNGLFALPTLKMLVSKGYDVAAVVTMVDKPSGRGKKLKPSPVKVYAESMGILVLQPDNLKSSEFQQQIKQLNATLGVVVEYCKLPYEVFSIPKWGTINLHSSLLPMYRGASTITSAIKDGSNLTGVTTFFINSGLDKGRIINNLGVEIAFRDSAEDVHIRLRNFGAEMMDDAIQRVAHSAKGIPQSDLLCDFIMPSHAPKLYRKDAEIRWCDSAENVYNFIRAHSSVVGGQFFPKEPAIAGSVPTAWTSVRMLGDDSSMDMKIHKALITEIPRGMHAPGEMFRDGDELMIACNDKLLAIDILQWPGKQRMTAKEFMNGYRDVCKGFCNPVPNEEEISAIEK